MTHRGKEWYRSGSHFFIFTWCADTAWPLDPALLKEGVFVLRALLPHLDYLHLLQGGAPLHGVLGADWDQAADIRRPPGGDDKNKIRGGSFKEKTTLEKSPPFPHPANGTTTLPLHRRRCSLKCQKKSREWELESVWSPMFLAKIVPLAVRSSLLFMYSCNHADNQHCDRFVKILEGRQSQLRDTWVE